MLTDDGVGAGCIDDGDLFEEIGGKGALDNAIRQHRLGLGLSESEQIDDGGGGCDTFRHDVGAGQGIDKGRFTRIELTNDDQQEEFAELQRGVPVIAVTGHSEAGRREWAALGVSSLYECADSVSAVGYSPDVATGAAADEQQNTLHGLLAKMPGIVRTWSR